MPAPPAPINFNGLVRQYYLRATPEMGDIQVNLVDKHQRDRQSHEIAVCVRDAVMAIAPSAAATPRWSKCRPGRRCSRPSSPRSMARTMRARSRSPRRCATSSRARRTSSASTTRSTTTHRKSVLRVTQSKAALLGVAQNDVVDIVRMGLSGEDVTPMHDGGDKYEIPVRITLPPSQ